MADRIVVILGGDVAGLVAVGGMPGLLGASERVVLATVVGGAGIHAE